MHAYADARQALSALLGDDAPLNFTWRRTDPIAISAFTAPYELNRMLGRTVAEKVVDQDGRLLAQAGETIDDRMAAVIMDAAVPEIQLAPQPSFLAIECPNAIGSIATAIAGLTALDIRVHTQMITIHEQHASQVRALIAERIRTEWTDAIVAPDTTVMQSVFPSLSTWHLALPSQLTVRCGMAKLAGWELPVVLLPPNSFHAWIAMRNVVIPSIEEVLELAPSAASTMLQLEEYIDVSSGETTILPVDIHRGFARPLPRDKAWNLADGYAVLLPDQVYEAGTPIEVWLPHGASGR